MGVDLFSAKVERQGYSSAGVVYFQHSTFKIYTCSVARVMAVYIHL